MYVFTPRLENTVNLSAAVIVQLTDGNGYTADQFYKENIAVRT